MKEALQGEELCSFHLSERKCAYVKTIGELQIKYCNPAAEDKEEPKIVAPHTALGVYLVSLYGRLFVKEGDDYLSFGKVDHNLYSSGDCSGVCYNIFGIFNYRGNRISVKELTFSSYYRLNDGIVAYDDKIFLLTDKPGRSKVLVFDLDTLQLLREIEHRETSIGTIHGDKLVTYIDGESVIVPLTGNQLPFRTDIPSDEPVMRHIGGGLTNVKGDLFYNLKTGRRIKLNEYLIHDLNTDGSVIITKIYIDKIRYRLYYCGKSVHIFDERPRIYQDGCYVVTKSQVYLPHTRLWYQLPSDSKYPLRPFFIRKCLACQADLRSKCILSILQNQIDYSELPPLIQGQMQ